MKNIKYIILLLLSPFLYWYIKEPYFKYVIFNRSDITANDFISDKDYYLGALRVSFSFGHSVDFIQEDIDYYGLYTVSMWRQLSLRYGLKYQNGFYRGLSYYFKSNAPDELKQLIKNHNINLYNEIW